MTVIKKILTANVVCASFLVPGMAHAQHLERTVVASAGASKTVIPWVSDAEPGVQIDCTVGDIAVRTIKYPEVAMLTQGFQQPPLQNLLKLNKDEMLVFPNPTFDQITLLYTLDSNVRKVDIRVVSIAGHIMSTDVFIPKERDIAFKYVMDCTRFIPGIYVVTLIMDTGIKVSRKFIKFDN